MAKWKFNGLRHRVAPTEHGAMAGYIEKLTHENNVKVLTKQEIQALYPGVAVRLRKETEEEGKARVLKNARMRSAALRKANKFTWK